MFHKLASDIYKTAMLKLANTLRDMVRLGRISPENFKSLRASKKYLPFEQYQNLSRLDKATYQQSLMRDLKSKLRGSGKTNYTSQYDNFMQNEFNGDFTKEQYNKLFGYQTEYPSIGRMSRGTIKGINNRVEDINKRINKYNNNPMNANRDKLPTLELGSSNHRNAKEFSLNEVSPETLAEIQKTPDGENKILQAAREELLNSGAKTLPVQNGKKLRISVPSTLESTDWDGERLLTPYSIVNSAIVENGDLSRYIPSVYNQPGVNIGSRAVVLQHEFDEALNGLNQISRLGRNHPALKKNVMNTTLNDSHASPNVIGNEFLTNNAIFGSTFNSPLALMRATKSFPVASIAKPEMNNLSAQAIGLDYSKPDGGFSKKFKNLKAFKKYLKQVQQNDIRVLQDGYYTDSVLTERIKPQIPYMTPELLAQLTDPVKGITKLVDPLYINAATTKYFPNWNRNITENTIDRYYKNLRRNINKNDHARSSSGAEAREKVRDFKRSLKMIRDYNISTQFPRNPEELEF